jgi:hypothetical protein
MSHSAKHKVMARKGKDEEGTLTANAVIVFRVSPLISAGMKASMKLGTLWREKRPELSGELTWFYEHGDARADVEGPKDGVGSRTKREEPCEDLPHNG